MQVKLEALLQSQVPNRNKVLFLAMASDIQELLDRGISKHQIYRHLQSEGVLRLTYSGFIKICARLLPGRNAARNSVLKDGIRPCGATHASRPRPNVFDYDPYNSEGDD